MKRILLFLLLFTAFGCSKDDSVGSGASPTFELNLEKTQLEPAPNALMYIVGTVKDDTGISTVRIEIPAWELDKTIAVKDGAKSYELNYKFPSPESATSANVEMFVTITDLGGAAVRYTLYPTSAGDDTAPEIYANKDIRQPLQDEYSMGYDGSPKNFKLSFDVTDNKTLSTITVSSSDLDAPYKKEVSVIGAEYSFMDNLTLTREGKYNIKIEASDSAGNVTTQDIVLIMSNLTDYDVLYLADVDTDVALISDLFGVPIEAVKDREYVFSSIYYSMEADTEIRFITSETTFSEMTFGLNSEGAFVSGQNTTDVLPVVLPKANQYYKITINLETKQITAVEHNPAYEDPNKNTKNGLLRGASGWMENPGWNPSVAIELTKHPENTFVMYTDVEVNASHSRLDYTFTGVGANVWNPQFRFRTATEPDILVPGNSGKFAQFPYTLTENTIFTFYIDTYTNRAKAVPTN